MHAGRRYTFYQTARWTFKYLLLFIVWAVIPPAIHHIFDWEWMHIPWEPISLIGIGVAFYLGFKNNSSYERLWEARKIWGGIVNASRSFTVMARDFVLDPAITDDHPEDTSHITRRLVHRHVAWLHCLTYDLRKLKTWEHQKASDHKLRDRLGTVHSSDIYDQLRPYLSDSDYDYIISKGNRSSHLLSLQSSDMMALRQEGTIEHFRHLEMQSMITEFYALQGKSERIKNFPFPRQYSAANHIFVSIFIFLLPFAMMDLFASADTGHMYWISIPLTALCAWMFWTMDLIGEYSENPFEGLFNDVPISQMARGIEIDIRQMIEETDLPDPVMPQGDLHLVV